MSDDVYITPFEFAVLGTLLNAARDAGPTFNIEYATIVDAADLEDHPVTAEWVDTWMRAWFDRGELLDPGTDYPRRIDEALTRLMSPISSHPAAVLAWTA